MEGRRLGRGEALRKLLETRPQEAGSSRDDGSPPTPLGRSALFAQLKKSVDTPPTTLSRLPPGRGRALLASLVAKSKETTDVEHLTEKQSNLNLSSTTTTAEGEKEVIIRKGVFGQQLSLAVNYVRLGIEQGKGVFQYDVQFDPMVDSKSIRSGMMNEFRDVIGETRLFDGRVLYLPFLLNDKVTTFQSTLKSDDSKVTIKITFTNQRKFGDPETIHLYNILFRRIMVILGLALHGKNFFDPKSAMPIPMHKLEVWPGYVTAIDEYEDGLMLCCDASHRILRNQTVLELMEDIKSSSSVRWKEDFVNLILGQSVLTKYNNKVYRVDDVGFDESPLDSFPKSNGEQMKYTDYYHQQYNIRIRETNQPLLKSKLKGKVRGMETNQLVSLVPELCYLTGITDAMRADMRVMKDITQCISISPNQRHFAITRFIKNIKDSPEAMKVLSNWGLCIDDAYLHLPGRCLPPIDILFKNSRANGTSNANWSGPCNKNRVLTSVDILNWVVVCTKRDDKSVISFVDQMCKFGPQIGIQFSQPRMVYMGDDRTDSYIRSLRSSINRNVQIVMVVFPMARADKYSAVKKLCCIEEPIPSQAMLSRTVRKAATSRAIVLKVALQMNCKLGGTLWTVHIPLRSSMVCGLDSYHDPSRRSSSVGALVCSLNQELTRWYSKIYNQDPGIELVDGLEVGMLSCLQKFQKVNNYYPEQVIIYRDGVSDGQLELCSNYEIPQIHKAFERISPQYKPKFLLVVVQKRINTKVFGFEKREGYTNPPPGTIIDHTVTRRYLYDFFLISQHVTQGTVNPTHYIVVHNTSTMSPDQVQRLSYAMTHLYYNWPGTIRVPAPCQYAHKLAYLVGESIHKPADDILADKLFYL